jgi:DnaJ-class molecular chaperone
VTTRAKLIDALDQLVGPFGAGPESRAPSGPLLMPRMAARRAHDATVVVSLSASETRNETLRLIRVKTSEPCSRCGGSGVRGSRKHRCRRCEGSGVEDVDRALRLRIPPVAGHGSELIVRGEGGRAEADGPRGDLFVRIEVDV